MTTNKRLLVSALALLGASSLITHAATTLSGDAALTALKEGNARYVAGKPVRPNQDAERRASVAKGQNPFAAFISCADSRVGPELVFDQGLGDLFVVRVAGNVANTDEIGSSEYGVEHLGAPLLVVLGHTKCGAVAAVMQGAEVHGNIPGAVKNIAPAAEKVKSANPGTPADKLVAQAVQANVWLTIDNVFEQSSIVRNLVKNGKLQVVGAVYDLETGAVNWLGQHPEQGRLLAYTGGAGADHGAGQGGADAHAAAGSAGTASSHDAPHNANAAAHAAAGTAADADGATSHAAKGAGVEPRIMRWVLGVGAGVLGVAFIAWYFVRSFMSRWKVPQRIAAGFTLILLVLAGVGFAGYEGLHSSLLDFTEYRKDARHSNAAATIIEHYLDMRIAAKDLVIFRNQDSIDRYDQHKGKLLEVVKSEKPVTEDPKHLKELETIENGIKEHAALHQQLRVATLANKSTDATQINKAMGSVGSAIQKAAEELEHSYQAEQNVLGPIVNRNMQEAQAAILSLGVGALVLGFFLAWLISRSIVAPLRNIADALNSGAEQTAAASAQVAAASQTLAEGASEQAASLEETSASLEEMTSMVKRNAEAAGKAKVIASETRTAADTGSTDMAEMKNAMSEIKTSSSEVAKIVKDIDEIAFQTNILALNAAVEAARAGEAGAGFAVVADEVRNLAQRSAASAKQTAVKIEDAIAKSERGVQISAKVAVSFESIATKTREVDQYVAEIASASNEQAQGVSQVNLAVTQMDKVTQSNAASAEESAAAAEELNAQAASVKESVETLQQLVGGSGTASVRPASRTAVTLVTSGPAKNAPKPAAAASHQQPKNGDGFPMPARAETKIHANPANGNGFQDF